MESFGPFDPPLFLGFHGATKKNPEFAGSNVTMPAVAGDGSGALNILYKDAGTGLNSDFLHVQWSVVTGNTHLQYQFQSEPFTLDPQTAINITRTETPGFMYLTPGDGLPGQLTIGVLSDFSPVPEPATYVAGLGAFVLMLGTFLRNPGKQDGQP